MDLPIAIPLFLGKRLLLSFNPRSGHRSGLQWSALRLMHTFSAMNNRGYILPRASLCIVNLMPRAMRLCALTDTGAVFD